MNAIIIEGLVGNSPWQYVVVHLTAEDPRLRIA